MKTYGEWKCRSSLLTSALHGDEWSASHIGRSTPRDTPWYSPDSKLGGLLSRSGRCGEKNLLPLPEIEPRFLGRLAHSQSLYRLSYPGSSCDEQVKR
jgi:hypothetical protein